MNSIQHTVVIATGEPRRLITCHANRGKKYRVEADQHGNFLTVEVSVAIRQPVECWRTIWRTDGGKDPSTTACCAMRAARTVLDSATK
jgi:hypothetical protein